MWSLWLPGGMSVGWLCSDETNLTLALGPCKPPDPNNLIVQTGCGRDPGSVVETSAPRPPFGDGAQEDTSASRVSSARP